MMIRWSIKRQKEIQTQKNKTLIEYDMDNDDNGHRIYIYTYVSLNYAIKGFSS